MDRSGTQVSESDLVLLRQLIERHLVPASSFLGAILVGSRVHGEARPDSDYDCVFIFDVVDERIIPGEFVWCPDDDSFHSIFDVEASEVGGIQVDAVGNRISWDEFVNGPWPEGLRHDLQVGIVLFDRGGDVREVLNRRTAYDEQTRLERLSAALSWADYHLEEWRLEQWASRGGWPGAHDQVDAAFDELIRALHAYNSRWMPYRYRRIPSTQKLAWQPEGLRDLVEQVQTTATYTLESLRERADAVRNAVDALRAQADADGIADALQEISGRPFSGLGFAGNMQQWRELHSEWLHSDT